LKEAEAPGGLRMMMTPKGYQASGSVTLSRLTDLLSTQMDRPVMDMTELKGTYQIELTWLPGEDGPGTKIQMRAEGAGEPPPGPKGSDIADAPPIFVALQETMGLKLEARKAPIDLIVVDHAEKIPTEN
jgi:uncharacterized protein (TIGR03435 family)